MTQKEFTANWTEIIKAGLKKFPDEFIEKMNCSELSLPAKSLIMGPEIFGSYEIIDADGNPVLQTNDQYKLKYILYAGRYRPSKLKIPVNPEEIKEAVRNYEKHLDKFLVEIEKEFKSNFPDAKDFYKISNMIFNNLSLQRF